MSKSYLPKKPRFQNTKCLLGFHLYSLSSINPTDSIELTCLHCRKIKALWKNPNSLGPLFKSKKTSLLNRLKRYLKLIRYKPPLPCKWVNWQKPYPDNQLTHTRDVVFGALKELSHTKIHPFGEDNLGDNVKRQWSVNFKDLSPEDQKAVLEYHKRT